MKVKCTVCGKEREITKIHKDYQRLASNPEGKFICYECERRLKFQAQKQKKHLRPI